MTANEDDDVGARDAELLRRWRGGDDAALPLLLERWQPAVYRFGMRMCRDPEDARDVLQETLLAAARGARLFREGASVSTWLFTIARSFCIKKRRGRGRAAARDALPLDAPEVATLAAPGVAPDDAAAGHEITAALDGAIGALPPESREVLLLRDVEGLSAAEVAAVVGVSVDAVKSRLHRARAFVRDRLAGLFVPVEPPGHAGCPDVTRILSRHLEGEIAADVCVEMERHVAGCAACAARCDALRRTLALCRASASADGAVPADVQDRVRVALRSPG